MDSTPLFRETTVGELLETAAVLLRAMRPSTCSWTARDAHRLAAYGGSQDAADLTAFEAQFRTKGTLEQQILTYFEYIYIYI